MLTTSTPFFMKSLEVTKRFLNTAVVVHDQAYFTESGEEPGELFEPDATTAVGEEESPVTASNQEKRVPPSPDRTLNAELLTKSFADANIVCSVLRPRGDGNPVFATATTLGRRADLVVLDWQIKNEEGLSDEGEKITEVIRSLTEVSPGRPQLIAIYTGYPDFMRIPEKLLDSFRTGERVALSNLSPDLVVIKNVWIAVFPKTLNPEETLPAKLIEVFCHVTRGLVSNTALEALSVLRENTYPLLTTLSRDLDVAYLYDRGVRAQPDDAVDVINDVIIAEIRSLLEEAHVGDSDQAREEVGDYLRASRGNNPPNGYTSALARLSLAREGVWN